MAKEIKVNNREDLFAATPPLEAKKALFSMAVTESIGHTRGRREEGMKIDFVDVRRAYFHAAARRVLYVELPEEDHEEGMCGKLNKAMYGTRDAAQNWEYEYVEFLEGIGFKRGAASPCVFMQEEKLIRAVVHGDDFTVLGFEEELNWFREKMEARYEVKFRGRLGPGKEDDKAIRILNRVVEWTEEGIRYEADQRHAEIILEQLGMKVTSKAVSTPVVKEAENEDEDQELMGSEATAYRAVVARGIYIWRKTALTYNML